MMLIYLKKKCTGTCEECENDGLWNSLGDKFNANLLCINDTQAIHN